MGLDNYSQRESRDAVAVKMTRKPRSIATLAEVANGYQIDLSLPFRRLVFSVSNLLKQADQYRLEDDIEEAYVLYLRFSKYAFFAVGAVVRY